MTDTQDWFETLFGFKEGEYEWTQSQFETVDGILKSRHSDKSFQIGLFSTPTLSELREQVNTDIGHSTVSHVVVGDALNKHADPESAGDMFQVASQFNALEFGSPEITPEDGITGYAFDMTQGPACSLAAAAGTVHRNYLVNLHGHIGQRRNSQVNNLATLESSLNGGPYWHVKNGYVESDEDSLKLLATELKKHNRDDLTGAVRIGIQEQTQVTFANRFAPLQNPHLVSQAFCSAISCAYSKVETAMWEPLATIVLEAAYEGTLLAAAIEKSRGTGSGRVWLTFIGGGVFGNKRSWIVSAMQNALGRSRHLGLEVNICHFRELQTPYKDIRI